MYIVAAILAFGILVLVHEFGHFIMAKANGIKVEEFSIGMGPKLMGIKGKETEYLIKLLPIGGYVKMLGDEEKSTDERAFNNKSPLRKLSVVVAGPFMNLVLSIVLFAIIASQRGYWAPIVEKVTPNGPAAVAGFMPGDKIVKVNDKKITTWDDFVTVVYSGNGAPLNINFTRNNVENNIKLTPIKDTKENRYMIGVYPTLIENLSFKESVKQGFTQTGSLAKQTVGFFKTLFQGKVSKNDVGGPLTIIKVSGKAAKAGIMNLMAFAAYISSQLAIFNIIPFPALDGGYIFLFLFEAITGKRVDENKLGFVNYIGFVILMGLMVLVTIKDILYPIKF
ncbi:zinc metalloprotease [Clostridium botulinum B2 128]|uniref:RIP metalloprotease RseP n=1 Tax=Clostridium botulinum TaxID=1491 RepID=UPI000581FC14|nr:RIP metalloprotease RseP [Clostridium botulinum]KEI76423.1 zinc metalloprotease [Clostridium botulinum B2 128]KEI90104.1 zinc metalloprotease [Clostridium botulinum B2 433]MCW6071797.1 RIP metalloprotease RseP [Clostridium botulinum]MCW6083551.1 RIP metalloprotease RseP [Clostridium botulinum]MCW6097093.1 RIP metalloprotease RseP [Clostridium botulinum]